MKKILLAIDPLEINTNTVDFACYIARASRSKLIGIFLDDYSLAESSSLASMPYGEPIRKVQNSAAEERHLIITKSMNEFHNLCANREVRSSVHSDSGVAVDELLKETRYADMLLLEPGMSFSSHPETLPSDFTKHILAKAECPVVITPYSFNEIEEVVFTYDESPSAVFAMKQFTYLFPEFADKGVTIMEVLNGHHLSENAKKQLQELLQMHYNKVRLQVLKGAEENELFRVLLKKKNAFVVMGAYGRNVFSEMFKHSTADILIKTSNIPFFIAHR